MRQSAYLYVVDNLAPAEENNVPRANLVPLDGQVTPPCAQVYRTVVAPARQDTDRLGALDHKAGAVEPRRIIAAPRVERPVELPRHCEEHLALRLRQHLHHPCHC